MITNRTCDSGRWLRANLELETEGQFTLVGQSKRLYALADHIEKEIKALSEKQRRVLAIAAQLEDLIEEAA